MPSNHKRISLFNHLAKKNTCIKDDIYYDNSQENYEVSSLVAQNDFLEATYLKQSSKQDYLSEKEEKELLLKAKKGDIKARDRIVTSMLRLVNRIARRYITAECFYLDLVEEGNFGLFKAIEKFDFKKGCRFSTYAAWWVQDYIERYRMNGPKIVHIPIHISKLQKRIQREYQNDFGLLDKKINIAEIANNLNKKNSDVKKAINCQDIVVSIDNNFFNPFDEKCFTESTVAHDDLCDSLINHHEINILNELIRKLPEKYYEVIVRRYGVLGFFPMSLLETSKDLSLTIETVRSRQAYGIKLLAQKHQSEIPYQRRA